ncbi:hypothetical protein OHB56_27010 [Streptomyces sp. NBC_01635]|uniref:hypothetical protein n=1 Tax=Streptomyces sp. NBC_01635 TaxID=2975904 RepID=UPI003866DD1A|nr:hypothetical protein OHB56_27010 [Streptomyces sp. NBC_01635]
MADWSSVGVKVGRLGLAPAVVRDLREFRDPVSAEEPEQFETDVLAGFVLARASAWPAGGTIRGDVGHPEQVRAWFGRPLWEMGPADADVYFGKVLRGSSSGTWLARAQALTTCEYGPRAFCNGPVYIFGSQALRAHRSCRRTATTATTAAVRGQAAYTIHDPLMVAG